MILTNSVDRQYNVHYYILRYLCLLDLCNQILDNFIFVFVLLFVNHMFLIVKYVFSCFYCRRLFYFVVLILIRLVGWHMNYYKFSLTAIVGAFLRFHS